MTKLPRSLCRLAAVVAVLAMSNAVIQMSSGAVRSPMEFAPEDDWTKPQEKPFRASVCLNGSWQFAPLDVPRGPYTTGEAPLLPPPPADGWSKTPIKIPSPWNVNVWGPGRNVGAGTDHPYWPDSVFYPSYPKEWDGKRMGWLRRKFTVDPAWKGRSVLLHFEAVGGACEVRVNGQVVAEHADTWLPFEADVTQHLKWDQPNELTVGVRAASLFAQTDARYDKFRFPFPNGSNTEGVTGIWQDVYLTALPAVRVDDVFVQPDVSGKRLVTQVTLRNDTDRPADVQVGGDVSPWVNLAGKGVADAPVPKWRLDAAVLSLAPVTASVPPRGTAVVTLNQPVDGQLKFWSPDSPQLYAAVLNVRQDGRDLDRHYSRFGWRQIKLSGRDVLLNGKKIQLFGDLLHPFGPYFQSRRFVWAYYTMIKDFGGNAVRPHAQVHPRAYLDLADEMGLLVLDETSVFGSSINLNPAPDAFWDRYAKHYDGLVLRDRNHPSVVGWSFGNEMFAVPALNKMSKADTDVYYDKLAAIGPRALKLDPTRELITCDGDEDLRGKLPVWSRHFGLSADPARLPDIDKPLIVGEASGTYYAKPGQLTAFGGDRAYENYVGRSEAMAVDVYQTVTKLTAKLAAFSASETSWFGIEHLPLGYTDVTRLPTLQDGVFFDKSYQEGKPGLQIERLPPYATTFNPGYDPSLPVYKPLPMFDAMKAALARPQALPSPWDHARPSTASTRPASPAPVSVTFLGQADSALRKRLDALGVDRGPLDRAGLLVIDAASLLPNNKAQVQRAVTGVLARHGKVLWMVADGKTDLTLMNAMLPAPTQLTQRTATAMRVAGADPLVTGLTLPALYFAEQDGPSKLIMGCGLGGPLVERAKSLLVASETDWSQFNSQPEFAKCAATLIYERLVKPSGVALLRTEQAGGTVAVCCVDYRIDTPATAAFWKHLLANFGVRTGTAETKAVGDKAAHDLLLDGPLN